MGVVPIVLNSFSIMPVGVCGFVVVSDDVGLVANCCFSSSEFFKFVFVVP